MIELAKHIEVLLLENDCVIVPGLGGFIAHHHSSVFNKDTGEFLPPMRSIGFNPQLTINDGLLVQSYMQAYNTDFPDATRKIETIVEHLKDDLYQRGQVSLNHLGTLYYNMSGSYTFEPVSDSCFTPSLYGLESVTLKRLKKETETAQIQPEVSVQEKVIAMQPEVRRKPTYTRRGVWMRNAVAAAVAIIMFFLLSPPVENTYVDNMGYASLGGSSLFDAIRNESALSFIAADGQMQQPQVYRTRNNVNTLKPVKVKTEKILPADEKATVTEKNTVANKQPEAAQKNRAEAVAKTATAEKQAKASSKATSKEKATYFIIAASLNSKEDAEKEKQAWVKKGYKQAEILTANGRYRIAIQGFAKKEDANRKLQDLKQHDEFQSAWIFTSK